MLIFVSRTETESKQTRKWSQWIWNVTNTYLLTYLLPITPNRKSSTSWTLWKMTLTYDLGMGTRPNFSPNYIITNQKADICNSFKVIMWTHTQINQMHHICMCLWIVIIVWQFSQIWTLRESSDHMIDWKLYYRYLGTSVLLRRGL